MVYIRLYQKQKPNYIQNGEFVKDFDKENAKLEREIIARAKESQEKLIKKQE